MQQVLPQHDLSETCRRSVEELHPGAVAPEAVEDEVGEDEERVGSRAREGQAKCIQQLEEGGLRGAGIEEGPLLAPPMRKTSSMKIGMISVSSMGPLRAR